MHIRNVANFNVKSKHYDPNKSFSYGSLAVLSFHCNNRQIDFFNTILYLLCNNIRQTSCVRVTDNYKLLSDEGKQTIVQRKRIDFGTG